MPLVTSWQIKSTRNLRYVVFTFYGLDNKSPFADAERYIAQDPAKAIRLSMGVVN